MGPPWGTHTRPRPIPLRTRSTLKRQGLVQLYTVSYSKLYTLFIYIYKTFSILESFSLALAYLIAHFLLHLVSAFSLSVFLITSFTPIFFFSRSLSLYRGLALHPISSNHTILRIRTLLHTFIVIVRVALLNACIANNRRTNRSVSSSAAFCISETEKNIKRQKKKTTNEQYSRVIHLSTTL